MLPPFAVHRIFLFWCVALFLESDSESGTAATLRMTNAQSETGLSRRCFGVVAAQNLPSVGGGLCQADINRYDRVCATLHSDAQRFADNALTGRANMIAEDCAAYATDACDRAQGSNTTAVSPARVLAQPSDMDTLCCSSLLFDGTGDRGERCVEDADCTRNELNPLTDPFLQCCTDCERNVLALGCPGANATVMSNACNWRTGPENSVKLQCLPDNRCRRGRRSWGSDVAPNFVSLNGAPTLLAILVLCVATGFCFMTLWGWLVWARDQHRQSLRLVSTDSETRNGQRHAQWRATSPSWAKRWLPKRWPPFQKLATDPAIVPIAFTTLLLLPVTLVAAGLVTRASQFCVEFRAALDHSVFEPGFTVDYCRCAWSDAANDAPDNWTKCYAVKATLAISGISIALTMVLSALRLLWQRKVLPLPWWLQVTGYVATPSGIPSALVYSISAAMASASGSMILLGLPSSSCGNGDGSGLPSWDEIESSVKSDSESTNLFSLACVNGAGAAISKRREGMIVAACAIIIGIISFFVAAYECLVLVVQKRLAVAAEAQRAAAAAGDLRSVDTSAGFAGRVLAYVCGIFWLRITAPNPSDDGTDPNTSKVGNRRGSWSCQEDDLVDVPPALRTAPRTTLGPTVVYSPSLDYKMTWLGPNGRAMGFYGAGVFFAAVALGLTETALFRCDDDGITKVIGGVPAGTTVCVCVGSSDPSSLLPCEVGRVTGVASLLLATVVMPCFAKRFGSGLWSFMGVNSRSFSIFSGAIMTILCVTTFSLIVRGQALNGFVNILCQNSDAYCTGGKACPAFWFLAFVMYVSSTLHDMALAFGFTSDLTRERSEELRAQGRICEFPEFLDVRWIPPGISSVYKGIRNRARSVAAYMRERRHRARMINIGAAARRAAVHVANQATRPWNIGYGGNTDRDRVGPSRSTGDIDSVDNWGAAGPEFDIEGLGGNDNIDGGEEQYGTHISSRPHPSHRKLSETGLGLGLANDSEAPASRRRATISDDDGSGRDASETAVQVGTHNRTHVDSPEFTGRRQVKLPPRLKPVHLPDNRARGGSRIATSSSQGSVLGRAVLPDIDGLPKRMVNQADSFAGIGAHKHPQQTAADAKVNNSGCEADSDSSESSFVASPSRQRRAATRQIQGSDGVISDTNLESDDSTSSGAPVIASRRQQRRLDPLALAPSVSPLSAVDSPSLGPRAALGPLGPIPATVPPATVPPEDIVITSDEGTPPRVNINDRVLDHVMDHVSGDELESTDDTLGSLPAAASLAGVPDTALQLQAASGPALTHQSLHDRGIESDGGEELQRMFSALADMGIKNDSPPKGASGMTSDYDSDVFSAAAKLGVTPSPRVKDLEFNEKGITLPPRMPARSRPLAKYKAPTGRGRGTLRDPSR